MLLVNAVGQNSRELTLLLTLQSLYGSLVNELCKGYFKKTRKEHSTDIIDLFFFFFE